MHDSLVKSMHCRNMCANCWLLVPVLIGRFTKLRHLAAVWGLTLHLTLTRACCRAQPRLSRDPRSAGQKKQAGEGNTGSRRARAASAAKAKAMSLIYIYRTAAATGVEPATFRA
jgi:hypothetical protein